jgi:molybdopterin-guanine dinucleotide biosynthesis protein A
MGSAAILAGGRATRFAGRDKSALVVDGRTILDRLIAELSEVADEILIVTGRTNEHVADALGPLHARVRVIADRVPDSGPLAGLDAALAAARDDALLLVACDMPFVTRQLLAYLLRLTEDADAVVPQSEHGYHPLCAAYTRACRPFVAARLRERRLKMADLMDDVRVRVVSPVELDAFGDRARLLANVNTPADFESLEARFGHEL